jgi:hypothetical protein
LLEGHARRALEQLEAIIAKGWHRREMGAVLNVYLGQTHLSLGDLSAALEAVRGVRGTAMLEVEALAVRLEASGRQGGVSQEALAEAEVLLATGRVPPLEGLELSRALA